MKMEKYWPNANTLYYVKRNTAGQVWGLTPIISALWEAETGVLPEARSSRSVWPTWQNPASLKSTKINWVWWCMPVIPAT